MSQLKPVLAYPNRASSYFLGRIASQNKILAQIRAVLPENLANQAQACVIEKRKLLIYVNSAAWASRLRFYSRAILTAVNDKTDAAPDTIQIRLLMPRQTDAWATSAPVKIPSEETIELLHSSAIHTPSERLAEALLNLSTTLKRLSG